MLCFKLNGNHLGTQQCLSQKMARLLSFSAGRFRRQQCQRGPSWAGPGTKGFAHATVLNYVHLDWEEKNHIWKGKGNRKKKADRNPAQGLDSMFAVYFITIAKAWANCIPEVISANLNRDLHFHTRSLQMGSSYRWHYFKNCFLVRSVWSFKYYHYQKSQDDFMFSLFPHKYWSQQFLRMKMIKEI